MENQVSFGPFCFEPVKGVLTRHGHRIKLQPKPAAVLGCLLEHPDVVVSRAQLQTRLWPEGTHVDYEAGIKVAVKKLRDALGDSSDEPVYIQTVAGEGYRFLSPLLAPPSPEAAGRGETPAVLDGAVPGAPVRSEMDRRTLCEAAIVALAVVMLGIVTLRLGNTARVPFQSRDFIVMAAFENRTGDKLLDGTMEYALERELSQSRYMNVAPQDRIDDTLKLMRQPPGTVLDDNLARQVAIRDGGIHAVVAGRIERFGEKYVLTVRLLNAATGDTAAVFQADGTPERLPGAARSISDSLRRALGENAGSEANAARLEKVTTPSLAALRAFSGGMKQVNQHKWDAAAVLFEEATGKDPQFASAHIYAAHCYSNLKRDEQAAPHYQAAFRLASGVSERERLFILGSYYASFLHDDRQALPFYQALVTLYPDDYWGVNNLAGSYGRLGNVAERIKGLERLRQLRPNEFAPILTQNLWQYYTFQHPDRARANPYADQLRRWAGTGSISPFALLDVATDRWRDGDLKGAAQEVARLSAYFASLHKGEFQANMAWVNLVLGRIHTAEDLCQSHDLSDTAIDLTVDRRQETPVKMSECLLIVAYARDDRKRGKEYLSAIDKSGPALVGYDVVLAMLWLGETSLAERWAKEGGISAVPWMTVLLHLARGQSEDALRQVKNGPDPAQNTIMTLWIRFGLASALERQGRLEEAIGILDPATRPARNYLLYAWPWPQCRAKVAELYRKSGRLDEAAKVENELRAYLAEADPDFPLLAHLGATPARHPPETYADSRAR